MDNQNGIAEVTRIVDGIHLLCENFEKALLLLFVITEAGKTPQGSSRAQVH